MMFDTEDVDAELAAMTPWQKLNARVEDAIGSHDGGFDDRDILERAFAEVPFGEGSVDDLSPEGMAALQRLEALPRTGWDDPADVPDDTPDNF